MKFSLTLREAAVCGVPLAALLVNSAFHIVCFRLTRGRSFMASGLQALALGFCFLLAVGVWLAESAPTGVHFLQRTILVHLPTYLCLSYCYYNFAQLGQTSLRVNLLRILRAKPEGIPLDSLTRQYGDHQAIPLRVGRLVTTGDLVESNGVLSVGRSRFVFTGLILFGLKRFLLGRSFDFKAPANPVITLPKH